MSASMMVACLSASKSVQSIATTMVSRAPMTNGTQRTRMSSTLIAGLESNRSTCLIACLGFRLRAAARPWPIVQIANEPLCNTPRVASQRELTRLACRSCSSKPLRTSRIALYEKRSLTTIVTPESMSGGRLAGHPSAGNRPHNFARIYRLRRLHDSFRNYPAAARFFYVAENMRGCLRLQRRVVLGHDRYDDRRIYGPRPLGDRRGMGLHELGFRRPGYP